MWGGIAMIRNRPNFSSRGNGNNSCGVGEPFAVGEVRNDEYLAVVGLAIKI